MSHYADYLRERTTDAIIEDDTGFATYRFTEDGRGVYLVDIYVVPEYRKKGVATEMANRIAKEAKNAGCTCIIGSVVPSNKGSTASLDVLRAYGMELVSSGVDILYFRKDI